MLLMYSLKKKELAMLTADQIVALISNEVVNRDGLEPGAMQESIRKAAEKIAELTKSDHTMLLAAQSLENEVTSTLMDMLAATILSTLIEEEGGGRSNISFSPNSMAHMTKHYTYVVESDGLTRKVSIQMREDSPLRHDMEAWMQPSNRHSVALDHSLNGDGAKPQAEPHVYDRPLWAVKGGGRLRNCHDRKDAETQCLSLTERNPEEVYTVENRYCLHWECPSTGCNEKDSTEVASEG